MKEQSIEQLFSDVFRHYQADVNPNAWSNIQYRLQVMDQQVSAGSIAGKRGLSTYGKLFIAGATLVAASAIYVATRESSVNTNQVNPITSIVQEEPNVVTPIKTQPAEATSTEQFKAVKPTPSGKAPKQSNSTALILANENSEPADNRITPSEELKSEGAPVNLMPPQKPKLDDGSLALKENSINSAQPSESKSAPAEETKETVSENADVEIENNKIAFHIPNTFTPNGDGQNDEFRPIGKNYSEFQLLIFDMNGNEVFSGKDEAAVWDGRLKNGDPAPEGKYYVAVMAKGLDENVQKIPGHIKLIRSR
jgi:gliding motility-associated-like protein